MKSLTLDFSKIKQIFSRRSKIPGKRNPGRDWLIVLCTTFVLFVIILACAVFIFYGVDKGTLFAPEDSAATIPPSLDRASINTVGTFYNDREAKLEQIRTSEPAVVDPSR